MEYHGETGYQVAKRIKRFSFSKMKDAKKRFSFFERFEQQLKKNMLPLDGNSND